MTLRLKDKQAIVADLAQVAKDALSAVVADYRGLTVAEMTELRAKAREMHVYLRVVRNTLMKRAFQDTDFACLAEALTGPLFLALSYDEPGAAAKLLRDFIKDHEQLEVKALALNGKLLSADQLEVIAKLPTRDQAIAILMGVLQAPICKFVRTTAEPCAKLTRTLAAIRDQKQTG